MSVSRIEVPVAQNENDIKDQFYALVEIIKILRKECPWDKKQTNESIAHLTIEEAYEVITAIENKDDKEFSKELGDLTLHIIMHAVMAEERNAFSLLDVLKQIQHKLVSRHPHVFGDEIVEEENEVLNKWESLKMKEGKKSILEGVPISLPALLRAERIQSKVSRRGFDWDNKEDMWNKVFEEIDEFKSELKSGNKEKIKAEFGDILFALVNAARFEDVVSEEALQITNNKFIKRFEFVEEKVRETGRIMEDFTLEELDKFWDLAKEKGL
jgi:MazG family protein